MFSSSSPERNSPRGSSLVEPDFQLEMLTTTTRVQSAQDLINKVVKLRYRNNMGDDNTPVGGHISYGEDVFLVTGITHDVRVTCDSNNTACFRVRRLVEYARDAKGLVGIGAANRAIYLNEKEHLIPMKLTTYYVPDSQDWGSSECLPVYARTTLEEQDASFGRYAEAAGCAGTLAVAGACLLGFAFFSKGCREIRVEGPAEQNVSRSTSHSDEQKMGR